MLFLGLKMLFLGLKKFKKIEFVLI